jgi:hypothetical protein
MNAFTPGLAPLLKLAGDLDDVADHIEHTLAYENPAAVAYVRRELWLAAERLIHVLESTWTGDNDASAATTA